MAIKRGTSDLTNLAQGTSTVSSVYQGTNLIYTNKSVTYVSNNSDIVNRATYTFTSQNFGGPGYIVVTVGGSSSSISQINSATINGVSASILVNYNAGVLTYAGIIAARVNSGTSGTISITFNNTMNNCQISVYRIQNNISDSAQETKTNTNTGSGSLTLTYTAATANDIIINVAYNRAATGSISWTNATTNVQIVNAEGSYASSSKQFLIDSTSATRIITATQNPSSGNRLMLAGVRIR